MLRPQGYGTIFGDIREQQEFDTISCGHCGKIVRVKPGTGATVYIFDKVYIDPKTRLATIIYEEEAGAGCRVCMRSICLPCCDRGTCTPLEKRMEQLEANGRFRKQAGLDPSHSLT